MHQDMRQAVAGPERRRAHSALPHAGRAPLRPRAHPDSATAARQPVLGPVEKDRREPDGGTRNQYHSHNDQRQRCVIASFLFKSITKYSAGKIAHSYQILPNIT